MKRGILPIFALATLFFSAPVAEAAIRQWSVDVGVAGGLNQIDADAEFKDTTIAGLRVGFAIFPNVSVEAAFSNTSTESAQTAFRGSDFTEDYVGIRLLGTFLATEEVKAMPYIVAGTGRLTAEFDPGNGAPVVDDEVTYSEIGAGVRYFIFKGLNARGEIVVLHSRVIDVTHSDIAFTAGVSWMFGGKK